MFHSSNSSNLFQKINKRNQTRKVIIFIKTIFLNWIFSFQFYYWKGQQTKTKKKILFSIKELYFLFLKFCSNTIAPENLFKQKLWLVWFLSTISTCNIFSIMFMKWKWKIVDNVHCGNRKKKIKMNKITLSFHFAYVDLVRCMIF